MARNGRRPFRGRRRGGITPRLTERLGVLGGTFDPVHLGHLDAADAAFTALSLDEVLFVPSHDPPHRPGDPRASGFHRFALAALAVNDRPGYRVSDMELVREGPSYTAHTLRALHGQGWRPSQLFFIIGSDAFAEIAAWYEYPAVLDAAHFVVIARPGLPVVQSLARTPELLPRARLASDGVDTDGRTAILLVQADTRDVSSTGIRRRLGDGEPIDDLVPPAVARHISTHHLYGAEDNLHGHDESH